MFFCFLFSNFVHCLKLILIHHHTRASYRKIPPWHDLVLHQNLTNSTSLLFVNMTDQWCMKLESSQLHAMTRVWAKSDPLSTSGRLCPGCCHHISHWELLKIHSSSSTLQHHHLHLIFLAFFNFFYLLLVLVCHLLIACSVESTNRVNQFKRFISMNLLPFNYAAHHTQVPLSEWRRRETAYLWAQREDDWHSVY